MRIGSGETTDIWRTNWIPRASLLRPFRCVSSPDAPQRVSELIDSTSATWDRTKLQEFFVPTDMEDILSIPLSTRRQDDYRAWHHENNGLFSVRSAYRMLAICKERGTSYLENVPG